jgi:predicted double-glycine peptidase
MLQPADLQVSLQPKYKQRVHVPNMTSLRTENVTSQTLSSTGLRPK